MKYILLWLGYELSQIAKVKKKQNQYSGSHKSRIYTSRSGAYQIGAQSPFGLADFLAQQCPIKIWPIL